MAASLNKPARLYLAIGTSEVESPESKAKKLLSRIQDRVGVYLNSKNPETLEEIFIALDGLKSLMNNMGEKSVLNLLKEIHKWDIL